MTHTLKITFRVSPSKGNCMPYNYVGIHYVRWLCLEYITPSNPKSNDEKGPSAWGKDKVTVGLRVMHTIEEVCVADEVDFLPPSIFSCFSLMF